MTDNRGPFLNKDENTAGQSPFLKIKRWQWWLLVAINIFFLIAGQSAAVLLGRFYYGGAPSISSTSPSVRILALIYFFLGVLIAGDTMLYSTGLLYLSASTSSLICASQLAFNATFSYFINFEKFTYLILNSVVVLSFSAALIAVNDDSDGPSGVSKCKYIIGFLCTLGASAIYSLLLSLMQLSFQKIIKKETFSVVLEMQIYISLVATCVSIIGLFASGEWKTLHGEMLTFGKGTMSYIMTLVWTAVCWQVCSVGVVGLIFLVSSLFSNVISTVALAVSPMAAVVVFHDKMNGVKVISLLMAFWGFGCYIYQNYLDDSKVRREQHDVIEIHHDSSF
ncbi:hypothetical protein P3X46_003924 [Hevea brasiliensis]|uniref:Probable purine permease n=1 Tax=Hevea brasiliensis TaxID=3981 RepID=A0ABQ9N8I6_HEVBR|nr:hypothetical protein P3X46_003924 [Hevea brasiliensis]